MHIYSIMTWLFTFSLDCVRKVFFELVVVNHIKSTKEKSMNTSRTDLNYARTELHTRNPDVVGCFTTVVSAMASFKNGLCFPTRAVIT